MGYIDNMGTKDYLNSSNSSFETVIFNPKEMLGILDLWLIWYYKIKHSGLLQNLSKYFRFESADIPHEHFSKFINTLIKEKEETNYKFPWLDKDGERRNMSENRY